ncbi:MAG: hypothetical protein J6Y62_00585 [Clostridia bacterium]|nr:hypothetical protein [Clostridia bacterium]
MDEKLKAQEHVLSELRLISRQIYAAKATDPKAVAGMLEDKAEELKDLEKIREELTGDLKDALAKLEEGVKLIMDGREKFETAHDLQMKKLEWLQSEIDRLTEEKKAIEKDLETEFKAFDKEEGVKKAQKAAAELLAELMAAGKPAATLIALLPKKAQEIMRASGSEQYSYKTMFETLVSMLNGTEYEKYVNLLKSTAKKNIAEFKATAYATVTSAKSFDAKLAEEYGARKEEWDKRHPEAPLPVLKAASSMRTAGFKDAFIKVAGWVKDKFGKLMEALAGLVGKLTATKSVAVDSKKDLEKLCKEINAMRFN